MLSASFVHRRTVFAQFLVLFRRRYSVLSGGSDGGEKGWNRYVRQGRLRDDSISKRPLSTTLGLRITYDPTTEEIVETRHVFWFRKTPSRSVNVREGAAFDEIGHERLIKLS